MHKISFKNQGQRSNLNFNLFQSHLSLARFNRSLAASTLLLALGISTLFGFYAVTTKAADASWITTEPAVTKLIDNATGDQPQRATQTCVEDSSAAFTRNSPGTPAISQTMTICGYKTSWGSIGFKAVPDQNTYAYMRLGNFGAYRRLWSNPFFDHAVPGSNKFIVTTRDRGNFNNMAILENPTFIVSSQYTEYGLEYGYSISGGSSTEIKSPSSNEALYINALGISQNGQWAVMETGNGFIRYDIERKTYFTFSPRLNVYGQGADPDYGLTISDDGRFAVISGEWNASGLRVYDLSTCVIPAGNPDQAAECQMRELSYLKPELNGLYFQYTTISRDGNVITTSAYDRSAYTQDVWRFKLPIVHQLDYLAMGDSFSSGEGDALSAVPVDLAILERNLPRAFLAQYYTSMRYLPGTDGNANPFAAENQGINTLVETCHISHRSYPFLLANYYNIGDGQSAGSRFKSVACTGSEHGDIINTSNLRKEGGGYRGRFDQLSSTATPDTIRALKDTALQSYIPGRAAQVQFLSKYKPKAATITISGNNIGFGTKIKDCIPSGTCDWATNAVKKKQIASDIKKQYSGIKQTIQTMRSASPATKLYVIGYPRIIKTDYSCPQMNAALDQAERIMADNIATYLNDVIQAAATSEGVMYVNVEDTLINKGLCSGELFPVVNGLRRGNDLPQIKLDDDSKMNLPVFGQESYHPNSRGHRLLFDAIRAQIGNPGYKPTCGTIYLNQTYCGPTVAEPATPTYFQASSDPHDVSLIETATMIARTTGQVIDTTGDIIAKAGEASGRVIIYARNNLHNTIQELVNLAPNTDSILELQSTPITLATGTTTSDGAIDIPFSIPAGTPPGYHTLHLKTTLATGEPIDLTQRIIVIASETDIDGDGVPNGSDQCPFVTPSGTDANRDGIDDACPTENDTMPRPPDVTAPTIAVPHYTANPKPAGHASTLSVRITDPAVAVSAPYSLPANISGLNVASPSSSTPPAAGAAAHTYAAEYFIGDTDPGLGRAAPLRLASSPAVSGSSTPATTPVTPTSATYYAALDTALPVGTHKLTIRARDKTGNWTTTTDYLVVYSLIGGRASGRIVMTPSTARGDLLPGLLYKTGTAPGTPSPSPVTPAQNNQAWSAFNVQFTRQPSPASHTVGNGSDMMFFYSTGTNCHDLTKAKNCQIMHLDASSITQFFTDGINGSTGTMYGTGTVKRTSTTDARSTNTTNPDGSITTTITPGVKSTSTQNVVFKVSFTDAMRKTTDTTAQDSFEVTVYPAGVDPRNPGTTKPIYKVPVVTVPRGTIRLY